MGWDGMGWDGVHKEHTVTHSCRQREDTIRCIVTSFTTDDEAQHTELFEEFRRGKNRLDKHGGYDGEDDDNDDDDDDAGDSTTDDEDATEKTGKQPLSFSLMLLLTDCDRRGKEMAT